MKPCSAPTAAGLAVLAAVIGGCTAQPADATPVPSPDASVVATVAATPSAAPTTASPQPSGTASPATEPRPLGPDAVAQVVTTDLVVRTLPEISDASVILEPYLDAPTLLYIVDGPVQANGYEWYRVQPFGMHYLDFMAQAPPFGWLAGGSRDGEEWIAPANIECPEPTLEAVRPMSETARLACYGGDELVLDGEFAGCFVADPTVGTPEWFFQTGCSLVPEGYDAGAVVPDPGGLRMRFAQDPGLPHHDPKAAIRVTGHFDDPAAATCRSVEVSDEGGGGPEPMSPEQAVLYCRGEFVLTGVEVRQP